MRVMVDNDFAGDPDGLFQLAHHLLSPSVEIPLVIGSHLHPRDFDPSNHQADHAVARVERMFAAMRLECRPRLVAGRNAASPAGAPPQATPAARAIIAEAMRSDTRLPLFYAAGAGLTDLAEALRLEPRIASRLTLIWIGGVEHADLTPEMPLRTDPEYNTTIDAAAVEFVFNESMVAIWQVPRNVYRQMLVTNAELTAGLRPAGRLGTFLLAELDKVRAFVSSNLGETYILGDSPLVTLTALQSPFEPDSSSSHYVVRPTPRIDTTGRYLPRAGGRPMRIYRTIDTRLTIEDMFAKFAMQGG